VRRKKKTRQRAEEKMRLNRFSYINMIELHLVLVGVRRLLLARANNDVDKAAVVQHALVGAAARLLLLVGLLDLRGLRLDLTGTCQRTVNLA
jgi:hypothetical protein